MSCDHNVSIMIMFVILNARLDTGSTNKVASNCIMKICISTSALSNSVHLNTSHQRDTYPSIFTPTIWLLFMQETIQFITEWPATLCHRRGLECTHAEVIPRWTVEFSCCKTATGQQKKSATTKGKRELFTTLKSGNLERQALFIKPQTQKKQAWSLPLPAGAKRILHLWNAEGWNLEKLSLIPKQNSAIYLFADLKRTSHHNDHTELWTVLTTH